MKGIDINCKGLSVIRYLWHLYVLCEKHLIIKKLSILAKSKSTKFKILYLCPIITVLRFLQYFLKYSKVPMAAIKQYLNRCVGPLWHSTTRTRDQTGKTAIHTNVLCTLFEGQLTITFPGSYVWTPSFPLGEYDTGFHYIVILWNNCNLPES